MNPPSFLSKENVKILWDILIDDPFSHLTREEYPGFSQYFHKELQIFYNTHVNSNTNTSLLILNRTFLSKIIQANPKPQIQQQQLYKSADIQADRINKFETEFTNKKMEFENAITLKKPPVPKFEDDQQYSEKISNMDSLIAQTLAQRNLDISQLNLNGTTNSNWLKPEETSVRAENTINNQNAIKLIKIDKTNLPELQEEIVDLNGKQNKKISWEQEDQVTSSLFSKLKIINSEEDKIDKINNRLDKLEKLMLQLLDQNKPNSHYS